MKKLNFEKFASKKVEATQASKVKGGTYTCWEQGKDWYDDHSGCCMYYKANGKPSHMDC